MQLEKIERPILWCGNETTLEDEIRNRAKSVARFLAEKGIVDKEGLTQYTDEDHENK